MTKAAEPKLKWGKFYWADWRSDPALKMCSLAARGLWIDMLSIMADAGGYLLVNDQKPDAAMLARVVGAAADEVEAGLEELDRNGVFSRDRRGVIYSRRMVSDEKKRRSGRDTGKLGGNPALCNSSENPPTVKGEDNGQDGDGDNAKRLEARDKRLDLFSEPNGSGADRAPQDLGKKAWAVAVQLLTTAGRMREPQARQFFGRLISENKLQAEDLLPALAQAEVSRTQDPQSYLRKAAAGIARRQAGRPASQSGDRVDLDWI